MLILKAVKVIYFDTLLQVLILNVLQKRVGEGKGLFGGCAWVCVCVCVRVRPEGGSHGVAPGVSAEGVDILVLGVLDGLKQSLAEIGESGCSSGFDLTLGEGGEKAAQSGAEIAGGQITVGEKRGYIAARLLGGEGLGFAPTMEARKVRMAGEPRSAATAAAGKGERTQRGTVFFMCDRRAVDGAIGGHGSSPEIKGLNYRKERSREKRDALLNQKHDTSDLPACQQEIFDRSPCRRVLDAARDVGEVEPDLDAAEVGAC